VAVTVLLVLLLVARQGVVAGERELRQYAQLVDSAADPAFICDGTGRLQLVNPAFVAAIAGRSATDLLGQDIFSLIASGTWPSEPELDTTGKSTPRGFSKSEAALALEQGWSGEVNLLRGDGSSFPVYLSLRPVPSTAATRPLLAGTAHDLSVQKRQQAALIAAYEEAAAARRAVEELNAQLEAKVDEKTRSLSHAYSQLERQNEALKTLDQLKSDFVSLVSHELRAPLTNISGGIELVLARQADLPSKTRDHLTLVQGEIRRLTSFVETILDLSALEAGRLPMNPAPLPLARLVESVRAQLAAAPGGERLRVQLPPDLPPVLADERALVSVLFHLVDNALKYAPEGEVVISAETDVFCVVRVRDHGPGVPAHLREAIFDKFQRLNGGDAQAVYGHGLGLYMVRHLLRAMRGDIRVEDTPGGGACFTFWLPVAWGEAL
jgi:PAS domain S-box-containing protein